jgi:uncharacterized membrane protein
MKEIPSHFCLGCLLDHKPMSINKQLVQLLVAILIFAFAPSIIGIFSQGSLEKIRDASPYKKLSQNVKHDVGKVIAIDKEEVIEDSLANSKVLSQNIKYQINVISENGKEKVIKQLYQSDFSDPKQKLTIGDELVIRQEPKIYDYNKDGEVNIFTIIDKFRLNNLIWVAIIFIIMIFALTGIRGLSSIIGMLFSFVVLTQILIPGIVNGANLIGLTFAVGLLVLSVTMFIGHGFTKKTLISLAAGVIAITLATFLSGWVVDFTMLSGFGTDDAFNLKGLSATNNINIRGLLISGIIIGVIGIMDDVTIAQAVAIEEISKANPSLTKIQLFWRGMTIGQDHIISLINTLVLAYAGTALPLVLSFTVNNFSPSWVIFNDQRIAEEIVRSLVGSMCILIAIPITNVLAAYFLKQKKEPLAKSNFSIVKQLENLK